MSERYGRPLDSTDALFAAQATAHSGRHALAMAGFIRWLAPRYGEISSNLESRRNRLGHQVRPIASHSRTPGIYGDVMIGLKQWMSFAREIKAVNEDQAAALEERAGVAVMAAISDQAQYLESADPSSVTANSFGRPLRAGTHISAPQVACRDPECTWGGPHSRVPRLGSRGVPPTECLYVKLSCPSVHTSYRRGPVPTPSLYPARRKINL